MSEQDRPNATVPISSATLDSSAVRRFRLVGVEGDSPGSSWTSAGGHCSIGSHPTNDLVLEDPTVSRFHCEIRIDEKGPRIRDLESRNGTTVDGVRVVEGYLRHGSVLRIGRSTLEFQLTSESNAQPVSGKKEFGSLVGHSVVMRTAFALLERAATSNSTVLLDGESGTGKEGAAEAIHAASARRQGPFLVMDCGAIPPNLIESELFGHEKGAFTGADARRIGAFEEAEGGTIVLDEIGELPLEMQARLLRVLERREVKRVGSNQMMAVDVRVIAATNRDLRADVNAGRFRPDLFFRLSVLHITLPPLRERTEDIPVLVERLLGHLGAPAEASAPLRSADFLASLTRHAWPGNVRELRNHLERCLVLQSPSTPGGSPVRESWTYDERRRAALDLFERQFVESILARHDGKVAAAAEEAGVDRAYLYRLMRRHGVSGKT